MDEFFGWVLTVLGFAAMAAGVLVGLDAVGLMPGQPWNGLLGMGLGCACLVGALWVWS